MLAPHERPYVGATLERSGENMAFTYPLLAEAGRLWSASSLERPWPIVHVDVMLKAAINSFISVEATSLPMVLGQDGIRWQVMQ